MSADGGPHVHRYRSVVTWQGSTAEGYRAYDRNHQVTCPPAATALDLSADPSFMGSPDQLNPEQLLVAAAASCQLLSLLAVAAKARLDVVGYHDQGDAVMDADDGTMRITRIDLHPTITLAGSVDARPSDERLVHLVDVAHRQCFIANSLTCQVHVHPEFHWNDV